MILEKIYLLARQSKSKVAIGVGLENEYISRTVKAAEEAIKKGFSEVILVGDEKIDKSIKFEAGDLELSDNPEELIIEMLRSKKIDAVVRGSLSASKTLEQLKKQFKLERIYRLGILETSKGHQFFFAPVGIDEGKNLIEKLEFIKKGVELIQKLDIEPNIAILSAGRKGDIGRYELVDRSLAEAEFVVERAKELGYAEKIKHYEILIEDAIEEKANFILAPDGVSGNLIYRTLVHLGSGFSHGAPILGLESYIDTSRVGPINEYVSAIALGSALSKWR